LEYINRQPFLPNFTVETFGFWQAKIPAYRSQSSPAVNYDTRQAIFAPYPRTIRARLLGGDFLTADFGKRTFGKFGARSW